MKFFAYTNLDDLPKRYDCLFEDQIKESLYLTRHWFETFMETCLGPKDECHIYVVESDTGKALLMLIARSPAGQNGSVYASWCPGSYSLASMTNFQSSYYAPLVATGPDINLDSVCQFMVEGILNDNGSCYMLDLNLLDLENSITISLIKAFDAKGFYNTRYLYKGNWFENFDGDNFSNYLSTRTKSAKKSIQNFQRKIRKFAKEDNIVIQTFCGTDKIEFIIDSYREIYDSSWKEVDAYPEFMEKLIKSCAEKGSMRFVLVTLFGKPAALEFAIVTGDDAVMMRTAYVSEFQKHSPGSIAMVSMIEYLLNIDHVRSIDFGTDDDPYKAIWVKNRRERWGVTFVKQNNLRGFITIIRLRLRRLNLWLRAFIKRVIGKRK